MVDLYRKVEPRTISGTGMQADPERIEELAAEYARVGRAWQLPPKMSFQEILEQTSLRPKEEEEKKPETKFKDAPSSGDLFAKIIAKAVKQFEGNVPLGYMPKSLGPR